MCMFLASYSYHENEWKKTKYKSNQSRNNIRDADWLHIKREEEKSAIITYSLKIHAVKNMDMSKKTTGATA